jgi:CheY-like chemotaxis protein
LLEDITKFSLSGSNVEVEFEFKDTLSIEADYGQISQVIQNIVINSKQAMPGGGKVKISTEDFMIDEEKPYLKITLKDNGVGILPEHLNKIFDPYFSTKQSGSGLGLSVCHSIINRHGGKIFVNSQFGIGTTFEILLPTSEQGIRKPEEKQNIVTQKLRVLIMDDEDSIREILKEILIELGHNVIESLEGNEAIKFYKQSLEEKEPFDIIFLDLTIKGGLGGKETVKKLREINQKVKVVVSSGYADSSIAGFKEAGFDAKLNKPYTIEEVNEVIFQIVNK